MHATNLGPRSPSDNAFESACIMKQIVHNPSSGPRERPPLHPILPIGFRP
ncbi:hypothetical protein AKJ09_09890 [Labilithrix luteola]|uniref:Uncharacterized protein n=1 Tax=Labilithrix luteola TaxID=1391654 RepID=A0A0K1QC50_9BACT|nr:hypothetical protein AKJ09_09890 [Labilithrix luteola]